MNVEAGIFCASSYLHSRACDDVFFSEARSRLLTITFLYTKENMLNMEMF